MRSTRCPSEITYGLERIAMYAQGVNSVYDIVWSYLPDGTPMTYGDVFLENEREFSAYNFEVANVDLMREKFDEYEAECRSSASTRTCRFPPMIA